MKNYKVFQTKSSIHDIENTAFYILNYIKNSFAADRFLENIEMEIEKLENFPYKYKDVGTDFHDLPIRLKPYGSYNIFYVIESNTQAVYVVRVLKDIQNWEWIMSK